MDDIESDEKPLVSYDFREFADLGCLARLGSILEASWAVFERLGGVLERLGGILEPSLSRLGAAAAFDAAFDAAAAGSKLSWWLEASCSRLGGVLDSLEGLVELQKTS